ncbi:division/cell wall cluster transcriptional repressor MraZ [Candidatus Gottesmanbacteria bacterium]|nr:division/cell wall cluster transcriptional repressor MraZ [Candidatus Gottesmanbacteria bacterium]
MKVFLGEYDHSIDERGRITLPRKIRFEINDHELILSRGFDSCIFGFDRERWERESEKQLETPITEEKGRSLRRYMFSAAEKVEIDKLGRILMPTHLKEYASIEKEVIIIGAGDHFEIWDKEKWEKYSMEMDAHG